MFEGTKNLGDIQEKRRLFSKINRFYLFYRILAFITIIFTSLSLTYPMLIPNPLSPQTREHIYNKKNRVTRGRNREARPTTANINNSHKEI